MRRRAWVDLGPERRPLPHSHDSTRPLGTSHPLFRRCGVSPVENNRGSPALASVGLPFSADVGPNGPWGPVGVYIISRGTPQKSTPLLFRGLGRSRPRDRRGLFFFGPEGRLEPYPARLDRLEIGPTNDIDVRFPWGEGPRSTGGGEVPHCRPK